MSEHNDVNQRFALLDTTLETFGGDANRWPDRVRAELEVFAAGNQDAQKRLSAARALDSVLAFAPTLSEAQNAALADRIVTRASRQPRIATTPPPTSRQWMGGRGNHGIAAAALAASLMLGVLAGKNTMFGALTDAVVGDGGTLSSAHVQQVAQGDDTDTILDEDLL